MSVLPSITGINMDAAIPIPVYATHSKIKDVLLLDVIVTKPVMLQIGAVVISMQLDVVMVRMKC